MNGRERIFIGIGSNIGDAIQNCKIAVNRLKKLDGFSVCRISSWYRTEPVGYKEQEWFVNGVVEGKSELIAAELLKKLQEIENVMGRVRKERWGPRVIDLDILFYGQQVMNLPHLVIPHPELHKRRFVLEPLCEIAPEWKHPLLGLTVDEMLSRLPSGEQIVERIEIA